MREDRVQSVVGNEMRDGVNTVGEKTGDCAQFLNASNSTEA